MPNFDPMTGKPLQETPLQETPQPPKKSNTAKIVISIVIGVIVLAMLTVAAFFAMRMFANPKKQVEKAFVKTFQDGGYLLDLLTTDFDLKEGENYSIDVDFKSGDATQDGALEGKMTYCTDGNVLQLVGTIGYEDVRLTIPEIEFAFQLDAEELRFKIPSFDDRVFTYDYTQEKTGAISYYVGDDAIQMMDEYLSSLYESNTVLDNTDALDFRDEIADWYKELKVKKTKSKSYEIDGAKHKSKGYVLTIEKDKMLDFIDIVNDYADAKLGEDQPQIEESFDEIRDMYEDLEKLEVYFYVYKNKLAAIEYEVSGNFQQILFKGGDYRFQNIEVLQDGESALKVTGNIENGEETIEVSILDDPTFQVSYEKATGKFHISIWNQDEELAMDGMISIDPTELTIEMETLEFQDYVLSGKLAIRKGAEIQEIRGEKLDLGNADEQAWNRISGKIFMALNSLAYGY